MLNTDRAEIMISGDVNTDEVVNKFSVLPFKARDISTNKHELYKR